MATNEVVVQKPNSSSQIKTVTHSLYRNIHQVDSEFYVKQNQLVN